MSNAVGEANGWQKGWWYCWCDGEQTTTFTAEWECDRECRAHCIKRGKKATYTSCHLVEAEHVSDSHDDDY